MKYVVSQYSTTRGDKSASDDFEFGSLEEARDFFDSIDVRGEWLTEKDCSFLGKVKEEVMVCELFSVDGEDDDKFGYIDLKQYGYDDYRKEDQ